MTCKEKLEHMLALKREVEILITMLQPHDTGHIHTTINILQERIQGLYREIYSSNGRND